MPVEKTVKLLKITFEGVVRCWFNITQSTLVIFDLFFKSNIFNLFKKNPKFKRDVNVTVAKSLFRQEQ